MPATVATTQPLGEPLGEGVGGAVREVVGLGVGEALALAPDEAVGVGEALREGLGHCTRRRPLLPVSHTSSARVSGDCTAQRGWLNCATAAGPFL
jgi:hypothetical protein